MGQCNNKEAVRTEGKATSDPTQQTDDNVMAADSPIISAESLKKLLDEKTGNLKILDVTAGQEEAYKSEHLDGAIFMDLYHKVENTDYLMRNLPTPEAFEAYAKSLSINGDSRIVIYDKADTGCGYLSASRGWFLFKYFGHDNVCVLDGGLAKWKEAGYECTSDTPTLEEGNFTVSLKAELLKTFDDIVKNLETKEYEVCDTRAPQAYSQGHILGALNVPFGGKLVDPDTKQFRTKQQLKDAFEESKIDATKPLVASCMGGLTSCCLLIAADILGKSDVSLYVGSWHEWNQRASEDQIEKS